MLDYNALKPGKIIVIDNEPYEVQTTAVVKKQRQKPVNQTKLKSLITGSVVERAFRQSDKIEEADITAREIRFIFCAKGVCTFSDTTNPKERFTLPESLVSDALSYLSENDVIEARIFEDDVIGIKLPIKMDIVVAEAPPNIRGNTSAGGDKVVTLVTGLSVTTPLFVETGDIIRVNTDTGAYVERVSKK